MSHAKMNDWAAHFARSRRRLDPLGWAASAATVMSLAAGSAIALQSTAPEGLADAQPEVILMDLTPPPLSVEAMTEPPPSQPMDEAPEPGKQAEIDTPPELVPEETAALEPLPELAPQQVSEPLPPDAEAVPEPEAEPEKKPKMELKPEPMPAKKREPKQEAKKEPKPKKKKASEASASHAGSDAKRQTTSKKAGTGRTAVSQGKLNDLTARWGASIRARIERKAATPKGSGGGTVLINLTVSRGGKLQKVWIAKSSGNGALDDAALRSVKSAGSFKAAPAELTDASYTFTLPVGFR